MNPMIDSMTLTLTNSIYNLSISFLSQPHLLSGNLRPTMKRSVDRVQWFSPVIEKNKEEKLDIRLNDTGKY